MLPSSRLAAPLGLLLLGAVSARGQAPAEVPRRSRPVEAAPPYAAAHDSLMRRVAQVCARAEARAGYFAASQGAFGGLHR